MSLSIDWRVTGQWALPAWFITISVLSANIFLSNHEIGIDATNYLGATRSWLAGGDPWIGRYGEFAFAAPPPTLLAVLPFALLPDPIGWTAMMLTGPIMVVLALRLLHLPWWWAAYPPLVVCVCVGNPGAWLPALMFVGPLAVLAKAYAGLPLLILGRWGDLVVTGLILVATFPFLAWDKFVADWPVVSSNLVLQTQNTVAGPLWLALPVLAVLLVRDRVRGGWLSVSVAWPQAQWSYSSIAIPAGWVCAILAVPVPGIGIVAAIAVIVATFSGRRTIGA